MAAASSKLRRAGRGIALGLGATLIALALHRTDAVRMFELKVLDFQFRALPTTAVSDDILHVDLDDKALDEIGRWPWPRQRLAQLVDVLTQCGARSVMLDILLPHPQPPRLVKEGLTDLYLGDDTYLLNPDAPPVPMLDDVELAEVLAGGGNIFLAFHLNIDRPARPDARRQLVEALAAEVATRPAMTRAQAAAEQDRPADEIDQAMATARAIAFERRTRAYLGDQPDLSRRRLATRLLGADQAGTEAADILTRVYLRQRSLAVMERLALPGGDFAALDLPTGRSVPPLVTFAKVISHAGFVTVDHDADGVVRRIPLLLRTDRGVFPQLALAMAADTLAGEHGGSCKISAAAGHVELSCPDGFRRAIPVDRQGYMLINFGRSKPTHHISAVAAQDVWKAREAMRRNQNLYRLACLKLATTDMENPSLLERFAQADKLWQEIHLALLNRQRALLFDPAAAGPGPTELLRQQEQLESSIDKDCREMVAFLRDQLKEAETDPAGLDEALTRLRSRMELIRRIEQERPQLKRQLDRATARLRQRVQGKICLVGSTSTGAGDFHPTPLHKQTPGVVVLANILNTVLSGEFVTEPNPLLAGLLVLLVGAFVAAVTATRGAISSAVLLAVAAVGYAAADAVVWKQWTYWMVFVAPVGAMLLCFTVVTAYRQLTEQRQKRQITNTFKQYLSPTMVDRLVDDPSRANLGGERRQLTCLFSDLAGFTSLSERLGPEGTVNLLNRYLDRLGEIVQVRHGGTLSKYEGDSVFVFFGAPLPQDDHAARALRAALDCRLLLSQFNPQARAEGLLPAGVHLSARFGITTGEALVGNMGSTQKKAYTAIGDTVNLAARLETANKFFETEILVDESAWQAGGAGLLGRPMGRILVVGKSEPVNVWEPLAESAHASDRLRKLAEEFDEGVRLYATGQFQAAREHFAGITDDAPARAYLRLCEQAVANPPNPADFDGVIRLTEK